MPIVDFKPVRTREELHERIDRHRRNLWITDHDVWFRGHSKVSYNLAPGLFRSPHFQWQLEHNAYADFLLQAKRMLPSGLTSWETLSTMQHWGAPTRLLDWTTHLQVALFFALHGETDNPTIWLLNPYDLNGKEFNTKRTFDELDKVPYQYVDALSESGPPHVAPMALSVAWMNERIERQSGHFTVHGKDAAPLNEQKAVKNYVRHVVIANELVPSLKKALLDEGVTPARFFPDLAGVCTTLKWKYEISSNRHAQRKAKLRNALLKNVPPSTDGA